MADKTIRPQNPDDGQGFDKTIRPQNPMQDIPDKTIRPQNPGQSAPDKTTRPQNLDESGVNRTIKPQQITDNQSHTIHPQIAAGGSNEKNRKAEAQEISRLNSTHEQEYILDGKTYKFMQVISEGTGEGDVFLVEKKGIKYTLKLYYPGSETPDPQILKEVQLTGSKIGLVDLYSYGTWKNPVTSEERFYELMQYCEGGSLAEYQLNGDEAQFKKLAVLMSQCIHACHEHGFIHGDIKPANFMFVDKAQTQLVLCDFGISLRCDNNGMAKNKSGARTGIYVAPEFYYSVPGEDGREVYTSSDYYSMGMSLLCLWMGENAFKQKESELMRLKISGKLQYPSEMIDHTLCLLKALTTVEPSSRCGFKEITEWGKGQNPFANFLPKKEMKSNFNIVFNAGKNEMAHSPEELADLMFKEQDLGIKYLYSGKISHWLQDNLHPELQVEMEDIVEKRYKSNHYAGLYAACYALNPSMPYYDVKGKACSTATEIASSVLHNQAEYQQNLCNNSDRLYIFLRSQGLVSLADSVCEKLTKPHASTNLRRDAIFELIYTLDPSQAFIVECQDNNTLEQIKCYDIKAIIDTFREHNVTTESWADLTCPSFLLWVGHRDKGAVARIQAILKDFTLYNTTNMPYGVLYGLDRRVNYFLEWNQESMFTYQHIAYHLNDMVDSILNPQKYSDDLVNYYNSLYLDLNSITGKRLYFYLKSKGSYDQWIDWIDACYELNSKDNKEKAGPYNKLIASYKCIKGMGVDPVYITAEEKSLLSLQDVKNLSPQEKVQETSPDRGLTAWLTIFFQEDPALDLSPKYTFEKKTVEYVRFLQQLNYKIEEVKRYNSASGEVRKNMFKIKRRYKGVLTVRWLLVFLCFVPLLALILLFCLVGLPFHDNPLTGHFSGFLCISAAILYIPICILTGLEGRLIGEAIISLVIGAVLFWVLNFLLTFVVPVASYLIAALLLFFGILILIKCYVKLPLGKGTMMTLTNRRQFEEMELEPLYYAFRTDGSQTFDSSIGDKMEDYVDYLGLSLKRLLWYAIPTMVLTGVLFFLLVVLTPKMLLQRTTVNERIQVIESTWTGTFDGKTSTIDITKATVNQVEGVVHVQFKTMTNEKVSGTIDTKKNIMRLKDLEKNGVLDGNYTCQFSDDSYSKITGTYYNPKNRKQLHFQYERPLSEAEISAEKTTTSKNVLQIWMDIIKDKFHHKKTA